MDIKLTKNDVYYNYSKVLKIGYCDAQSLLFRSKIAHKVGYCCGVYGWNCDVFEIHIKNRIYCIVTGYRPFGKQCNYELLRSYERRAKAKINNNYKANNDRLLTNYILKEFKEV